VLVCGVFCAGGPRQAWAKKITLTKGMGKLPADRLARRANCSGCPALKSNADDHSARGEFFREGGGTMSSGSE
jgi:hypothetical protein